MTQEQKQEIALFRYSIIAPLVNDTKDPAVSYAQYYRQAAQKTYTGPGGKTVHVSAPTIQKWHLDYRKNGFDALMPHGRSDEGASRRLGQDTQERIRYLKKEYPKMTAAEIYRRLKADGTMAAGEFSISTVERFVKTVLNDENLTQNKDMRRYELAHINDVWCGDTSYGPYLHTDCGKKRVYVIALLDDASRFIVGADLFLNDTFENLMMVMKSAVSKYGKPKIWNFDNGRTYRNRQMELLSARLGTTVRFCQPYTPTGKAKIERWFSSMKMQWMSGLDMREFGSLDQLRDNFAAYVQSYNQTVHSSLDGKTPQDRFFSEPEHIRRPAPEKIENDFLFEIERRVSADCVIVIDRTEYEVDCRYAKQRIRLRYAPDMKKIYVVEASGALVPIRLLNKQDNAVIKREKIRLTGGET